MAKGKQWAENSEKMKNKEAHMPILLKKKYNCSSPSQPKTKISSWEESMLFGSQPAWMTYINKHKRNNHGLKKQADLLKRWEAK